VKIRNDIGSIQHFFVAQLQAAEEKLEIDAPITCRSSDLEMLSSTAL
jgi:hypothetical protein